MARPNLLASRNTAPGLRWGRRQSGQAVPPAPFFDVARPGGASWVRSSLWKQGVAEAAARSEVVAGCGASDRSPDQPAPAHGERGEHVFATGAPHLASGSGSVVRLCLGQPPDPHVIRPPWKPRPGRGIALPASLLLGNGSPRRSRAPTTHKNRVGPGGEPNALASTLPILVAQRNLH